MDNISKSLQKNILEYIIYEINAKKYTADCQESLEVAKQCLETAWNIEDGSESTNLLTIFMNGSQSFIDNKLSVAKDEYIEVDEDDKLAAERLKVQGNICMEEKLFMDAVNCYSKAIDLDPRNAVYYCNRAAAYSKMSKNECAIDDCKAALNIDPKYGKAYSRMGLAHTAMGNFEDAINCYKQAIEIEPDNSNYKQNLQAAEERKSSGINSNTGQSRSSSIGGIPSLQSALQNFDLSSILNNPAMMNMAQQMMSQPEMRNMMSHVMQSMMSQSGATGGDTMLSHNDGSTNLNDDGSRNINEFLSFGHQMAQQMQSANPELVNSLRNQFHESSKAEDTSDKQK